MKTTNKIILIAAILGLILSIYLTYSHFQGTPYCIGGQEEACDIVGQSIWSELFGIPVSIFGALTFICFATGAILFKKKHVPRLMFSLALFATGFETYITYMAKSVLDALCPYCLIVYGLLIVTLICTFINLKRK